MIEIYDHRGYFTIEYVREIAKRMAHGKNCDCEQCKSRTRPAKTPVPTEKGLRGLPNNGGDR